MKQENDYDPYVLRVRGLPWSASKEDIVKFFEGCNLKSGATAIHLTMSREGRPSGEAYVEFETEDDANKGLEKNNEHLGSRYIEVFRSKPNEMEWALRKCGLDGEEPFGDACVRLRGLPFGCSKEEIAQFFTGLEIVRNGITLPTDFNGRSTGEAYVQFASQEIAEKAMGKHKEKIGHRYIEIFKSSLQEIRNAMGMGPMRSRGMGSTRPSPYDRGERSGRGGRPSRGGAPTPSGLVDRGFGGLADQGVRDTGHNVHLRGLPFRAVERDIFEFFAPIKPIAVRIKYRSTGRSTGQADAMFATHEEASRAMKKDKEKIQHRYIELFLQSEPDMFGHDMPYDGPAGPAQFNRNRSFMSDPADAFEGAGMGQGRGYDNPGMPDRGFGGRNFSGGGFDAEYSNSPGAVPPRNYEDRDYGYGVDKPFPQEAERNFAGGPARRFPEEPRNAPDRNYGATAAPDRGYGSGGRPYNPDSNMGSGYGNYRNGMQGPAAARGNNYGSERSGDSEFFGSGKLFGGSNYPAGGNQNVNMMGPTTYPGF